MEKLVLLSLVSALMAGCVGNESYTKIGNYFKGSDKNPVTEIEDTESEGTDTENNADDTEKVYNATVTTSDLEGSWRKPCGHVEGEAHYDIVTVSFSRSEFTTDIKNYLDAGCTSPLPGAPNPTSLSKFTLGNGVMLNDGTIVTEVDSRTMRYDGAHFYPEEHSIVYIKNDTLYTGADDQDTLQRPTRLDYNRPFHKIN